MPPSAATNQYPLPDGVAAIPTIGELSRWDPVEPKNLASPKAKMPPSAATSQYPRPDTVDAMPTIGELRCMAPVEPWNWTARAAESELQVISTLTSAITTQCRRPPRLSTIARLVSTRGARVNALMDSFRYFVSSPKAGGPLPALLCHCLRTRVLCVVVRREA